MGRSAALSSSSAGGSGGVGVDVDEAILTEMDGTFGEEDEKVIMLMSQVNLANHFTFNRGVGAFGIAGLSPWLKTAR